MNGHEWLNYIQDRRPEYAVSRKPLIERFANKGNSKGDFTQFGPVYQIFMYAFMLGFHQHERIPLPRPASERTPFLEIGKWRPDGLVDYLLMLLLSHPPILKEAEIDFVAMEDMTEEEVKSKFNHLIKIMEEYANGGFSIIQERYDSNPYFFNDSFAFAMLLKEVAEGKFKASVSVT
jgi:hypothetical protein